MKKLLPFLFMLSAPAYADMTHNISSSVKFESLSAASTADKVARQDGMVQTIRVVTPIKIEGAEVIDPKPKK